MRQSFPPFLTPAEDAVIHGGWRLDTPQGDLPLPNEMQHWDYQTTLKLSASVQILRSSILETCDLAEATSLVLLVTAQSDHTRTERTVACLDIPREPTFDLAVRIQLPGTELGGRLTLNTSLVAADPKPTSDLAPSDRASILWKVRHQTHLQGISAQFPTDASDFSVTHPLNKHAAWHLLIDTTDPDARFMSAARLTLNTRFPEIQNLLSGGNDDATKLLERTLRWDVTRQLVLSGLRLDEARQVEFNPDATTVAGVLRNAIAAVWPAMTTDQVHSRLINEPTRIELDLQHHCRILR